MPQLNDLKYDFLRSGAGGSQAGALPEMFVGYLDDFAGVVGTGDMNTDEQELHNVSGFKDGFAMNDGWMATIASLDAANDAPQINERWFQHWGGTLGGGSPADAVLARFGALDGTETAAITAFVNGLDADGIWDDIFEVYAPCLNATDFLIGMKTDTLIQTGGTHQPGQGIEFTTNNQYLLEGRDFDTFAQANMFFGCYSVATIADTTTNRDYFGVATAAVECYLRWRGTDTNDVNSVYFVTGSTPRTVPAGAPDSDFIGCGLDGATVRELHNGGVVLSAARTFEGIPASNPMQWFGQNIDGVPSVGNKRLSRYSIMAHLADPSDARIQTLRSRSLQFLRDLGVAGVPAT